MREGTSIKTERLFYAFFNVIIICVDNLDVGIHGVTIEVSDGHGGVFMDGVWVTVINSGENDHENPKEDDTKPDDNNAEEIEDLTQQIQQLQQQLQQLVLLLGIGVAILIIAFGLMVFLRFKGLKKMIERNQDIPEKKIVTENKVELKKK